MVFREFSRWALWFLMLAYAPLILAAVALMAWGAYELTLWAYAQLISSGTPRTFRVLLVLLGLLVLSVDLAVLTLSLALLRGLSAIFWREPAGKRHDFSGGLKPEQHKNLFELIERFSKRLGTRPPDVVLFSPFDETCISEPLIVDPDTGRRQRLRVLELGAALIIHLRIDEFGTILCHEMAHAAAGDTRLMPFVLRFLRSMAAVGVMISAQEEQDEGVGGPGILGTIAHAVLGTYFKLIILLTMAEYRRHEYCADRMAAKICGPQNVRNMLVKVHVIHYRPEMTIKALFVKYSENEAPVENIYQEHRDRWKAMSQLELREVEGKMMSQKYSHWHTHPTLKQRLANLKHVEGKEWSVDKPATRLFSKWEEMEPLATRELIRVGRAMVDEYYMNLDRDLQRRHRDVDELHAFVQAF